MKSFFILLIMIVSEHTFSQKVMSLNLSDEKVKVWAKEIYAGVDAYLTAEHLALYQQTAMRIEIVLVSDEFLVNRNFKLISTLGLMNKYNPDLDYDKGPVFDIKTFNPLKYFFPSENTDGSSNYYRIYQTNYLVRLLPN